MTQNPSRWHRAAVRPARLLRTTRRGLLALAGGGALAARLGPRRVGAQSTDSTAGLDNAVPQGTSEYFASTGHNLGEPFLSAWSANGGEAVFGPPLSEDRYATGAGGVLQTFRNLTLVYDPSQPAPLDVRGKPFDKTQWRDLAPFDALRGLDACPGTDATCQYFEETGHTVTGAIGAFWAAHGGASTFGIPVSEPYADPDGTGSTLQLFLSALVEQRPDGSVLLRPLGQSAVDANPSDPSFAAAPPNGGTTYQVNSDEGLRLRSGPDPNAGMIEVLPNQAEFIAASPSGDWTPGYSDGKSGWVASQYLTDAPPLPQLQVADWNLSEWQGAALSETNVRAEPTTSAAIKRTLAFGDAVTVAQWVSGEEVFPDADIWAALDGGGYVFARNVGRNAPVAPTPLPPDAPAAGKWIDVDLTQQLMTAYQDQTPVRTVPVTTGKPGWETPAGQFAINTRVANETMTSGAIGAENHYKLEDVLFTQYFTDYGHAIHFAWWRTKETIGRPGSHGCVNLLLDDARFFWDWAELGTPVIVHA